MFISSSPRVADRNAIRDAIKCVDGCEINVATVWIFSAINVNVHNKLETSVVGVTFEPPTEITDGTVFEFF